MGVVEMTDFYGDVTPTLDERKKKAINRVRQIAAYYRAQVITPGKDTEYAAKLEWARSGSQPPTGIIAEAEVRNLTVQQLCGLIKSQHFVCAGKLMDISATETTAKLNINAATTEDAINNILASIEWPKS